MMRETSIRMPRVMLKQLQTLANIESLRQGRQITWASLVRGVINKHLLEPNAGLVVMANGDEACHE